MDRRLFLSSVSAMALLSLLSSETKTNQSACRAFTLNKLDRLISTSQGTSIVRPVIINGQSYYTIWV